MVLSATVLNGLFIIPLILIGIITSISDIKSGKIKNSHLRFGYIYTLLLFIFLTIYSLVFVEQHTNLKYLFELVVNGTIAFVIGYLLWYFNLWAAGDAKLFPLYALLIPMEYYFKNHVPNFPSLTILTDTFIIISLALLLKIFLIIFKSSIKYLKKPYSLLSLIPKPILKTIKKPFVAFSKNFIFSANLLILIQFLMINFPSIQNATIFKIPIAYLLFFPVQMYLSRKLLKYKLSIIFVSLFGLFCSVVMITTGHISTLIMALKMSVMFLLILGIVMQLINKYIDQKEIRIVKINDLKAGCFLAPQSLDLITAKIRQRVVTGDLYLSCSDGLSKSQIKTIQRLFKNDTIQELYICHTFPFAPFMFLSFIFLIIFKESFLFFIINK